MVSRVITGAHYGLRDWLGQRVTAVIMAVYTVVIGAILLFGAPGGAELDVVALACTHFPLLAPELAAAAPRPCVWLDSGEAIARRVANVLIARPGQARTHRAAFTDAGAARAVFPAFHARGFTAAAAVSDAPHFDVQLLSDFASV
jgi:glutamate racemase